MAALGLSVRRVSYWSGVRQRLIPALAVGVVTGAVARVHRRLGFAVLIGLVVLVASTKVVFDGLGE
jgi:hypothetical protein